MTIDINEVKWAKERLRNSIKRAIEEYREETGLTPMVQTKTELIQIDALQPSVITFDLEITQYI